MKYKLQFSQYNEHSVLVEWPAIIDELTLESILNFKNSIQNIYIKDKVEVITAYNSILVIYNFTIENINDELLKLKQLFLHKNETKKIIPSIWEIPVCYDDDFAIDLENYSKEKKLSKDEIIKLHSEAVYTVFFIGFLPGFLYLGGLHSALHLYRKTTPNLNVKKGSVAIGGEQTGIYPQDSPGGWHVIGNSPIELFNPKQNPPCFIKAGDKVKFDPISKFEYLKIQEEVSDSTFNSKSLLIHD